MSMRKWKREQAAKDDKQQAKLDLSQLSGLKPVAPPVTVTIQQQYQGEYCCPFCLHQDVIDHFLISTKKGFNKRLGECPECHSKAELKSITASWTPEEYAEFAFGYTKMGFWQKVKWQLWRYRLEKAGWAQRFWKRYRELKGEPTTETYQDYIQRKQYEEAKEKGWTE